MPSNHLPASALLLNRCITCTSASIAALSAAKGSKGGASVASSLRSGFRDAQILGIPLQADSLLVDAAAPPGKKMRRERRAGSIPLKWYTVSYSAAQCVVEWSANLSLRSSSLQYTGTCSEPLRVELAPHGLLPGMAGGDVPLLHGDGPCATIYTSTAAMKDFKTEERREGPRGREACASE